MFNNAAPCISTVDLFKRRVLYECVLQTLIPSLSLTESVLHLTQLLSSREDAADPCALVVVANTCIHTFLMC